MTPSEIGERAEAAVLHALVFAGKTVLLPFGGSCRYDLVYDDESGLHRVQCKAGRLLGDVVVFRTCSQTGRVQKDYHGQVDEFGVYCDARREVYLVPVDGLPARAVSLRLAPTRSGQVKRVTWARDFVIAADGAPRLFEGDEFFVEPGE